MREKYPDFSILQDNLLNEIDRQSALYSHTDRSIYDYYDKNVDDSDDVLEEMYQLSKNYFDKLKEFAKNIIEKEIRCLENDIWTT